MNTTPRCLPGRRFERRLRHEDLAGDARRPVGVAELCERFGDGRRRPEDDDLGRHHAAGGRFLVGQQPGDDLGLVVVHRREDRGALMGRHLAEQVGEVVVLHLVEHADETIEVEPLDEAELLGLGELLEHVGESFVVHRLGELATLRERHRAHDVGDVARVHVAQPRGLGFHRRVGGEEPGDLAPVDEPVARPTAQRVAAREANLGDLPAGGAAVGLLEQADVADALTALDLLIDDLVADQRLAGAWLERVEVDVPAPEPDAVAVEFGDPRRVDEDPAMLTGGDEPGDTRRLADSAGHDDDVLDLADLGAAGVEQRQAHHPERVDQLACHAAQATPWPWSASGAHEPQSSTDHHRWPTFVDAHVVGQRVDVATDERLPSGAIVVDVFRPSPPAATIVMLDSSSSSARGRCRR